MSEDLAAIARSIIDANSYLTLATGDGSGTPWATPVWFAHDGYTKFIWLSRTSTRHSVNLASRAEVGIVVFDSTVPINQGQAVYAEAVGEEIPATELKAAIAVYSARSVAAGGRPWQVADVVAPASFRLFSARATALYVLDAHDSRVPVDLARA
ncbi:pyridoxamine 5'-phosphate oxidase family protein [Catelliglobosispora koreensis]|uniref:pyridoxamine 5'-phosphate oxidase family protein n=1 Tax=Catelliglobosispora koreensis TaxID=129052 RepID=UPI00036549C3|nr:pyridoxamine 5'-phosphate oxidase family protein [Catelliglobosispora koreensis]